MSSLPPEPPVPTLPLVVQHNALVNARFELTTTEARLFLAMLARIRRDDTSFQYVELSARELLEPGASQNYGHVRKVLEKFASRLITLETLGTRGKRLKQRKYAAMPLLARAEYVEGEGLLVLRFNDELHDYLLELHDNFTKAQLTELLKLKSASSYRIYWLLREYAAFGKRTLALEELKAILGLSEGYDRFNNFRARVLERAREELAETDLPFTYTTVSRGRLVTHVEFQFPPLGAAGALPAPAGAEWEAAVLAAGVAPASLPALRARLDAGDYDLGYVRYVLATVRAQAQAGKVKNEGGAVFKALAEGYLLPAYRQSTAPATGPTATPARPAAGRAARRKKLLSQLDDARNSRTFIQTAIIYTDATRAEALASVQASIAALEAELHRLNEA